MQIDAKLIADAVIDAWHADACMIGLGYRLQRLGDGSEDAAVCVREFAELLGESNSFAWHYKQPVRAFLRKYAFKVSEAFWDGAPSERLRILLRRRLGETWLSKGVRVPVRARSLSKWHDWGTVK